MLVQFNVKAASSDISCMVTTSHKIWPPVFFADYNPEKLNIAAENMSLLQELVTVHLFNSE